MVSAQVSAQPSPSTRLGPGRLASLGDTYVRHSQSFLLRTS